MKFSFLALVQHTTLQTTNLTQKHKNTKTQKNTKMVFDITSWYIWGNKPSDVEADVIDEGWEKVEIPVRSPFAPKLSDSQEKILVGSLSRYSGTTDDETKRKEELHKISYFLGVDVETCERIINEKSA